MPPIARTCRLHLRYPDTFAGTNAYLRKLTTVFANLNTHVNFATASSVAIGDGRLDTIDAGNCAGAPAQDVVDLFDEFAPQPLGNDDVTVFFVGRLTGATKLGCANSPTGFRGVVVSCEAKAIVLPHEIAHLFLGEGHEPVDDQNLMWANTDEIVTPPVLSTYQRQQIQTGNWATAAPPMVVAVEMANGVGKMPKRKATKKRTMRKKKKTAPRKKSG